MLYLARAIGIGGDQVMPPLMTGRAKIGLRPAIGFVVEQMPRRPVMIFGAFGATNLANKRKLKWVKLLDFDVGFFNSFSTRKPRNSFAAIHAVERIFRIATSVNVMPNSPCFYTAVFAWVIRVGNVIFPRGICHEAMPILR